MMLLYFIEDRRPAFVGSPFEAKSWVVTIDYSLLRYDRERSDDLPVCIHPSWLVQMLQFWVPRTEAFEAAMVESLRIPFVFGRFDAASEKAALRILEVLSRFEVGDLSSEVITQLLLDDAVNTAIAKAGDQETEDEIVKERLSSADAELKLRLGETREEAQRLRSITEQQSNEIGELQRNVGRGSATVEKLERELRHSGRSLHGRRKEISELRAKLSKSELDSAATELILDYAFKWVLYPAIVASLIVAGTGWLASALDFASPVTATAVVAVAGLAVVLGVADWRGAKIEDVRRTTWYTRLSKLRRWGYGVLGFIFLSLVGDFVWEHVRDRREGWPRGVGGRRRGSRDALNNRLQAGPS